MRRTKEEGLVERMIYGSDGPQFPGFLADYAERTRDAMLAADYTLAEAQAVFKNNLSASLGWRHDRGGCARSGCERLEPLRLSLGFPWTGLRLGAPIGAASTAGLEAETALARRFEARGFVQRHVALAPRWSAQTEAAGGWVIQSPSVARQGVQLVGRVGLRYQRRYAPFVLLDVRQLISLRELSIASAQGTRTEWRTQTLYSVLCHLGVERVLSPTLTLTGRFVFGEVDGVFAIPGAALGLRWSRR